MNKPFVVSCLFALLFLSCQAENTMMNSLPETVPYLGPKEDYFVGSGVSGAMGGADGIWHALIGPNYTSPNFLKREWLSILIDGKRIDLRPEMHRARKTGIFYGKVDTMRISIYVIDFTNDNMPWVTRCISVTNHSATAHRLHVVATLEPGSCLASVADREAVSLYADTTQWTFDSVNKESKNWADRFSLITFNRACQVAQHGDRFELLTDEISLPGHRAAHAALYHYQHYREPGKQLGDYIRLIRSRNIETDLNHSINDWKRWIDKGNMYDEQVQVQKARDIIEGDLLIIKMLQDSSGGIIAGLGEYPHSYVRDSHGACRLFALTGHNGELRKVIQTICDKTDYWQHIPNAWQMGANTWHLYKFNNPNAETPAYFIYLIKYYLENTLDTAYVERIFPFMQKAIDVQLNDMASNNWRLDFNGDETERYTVRKDGDLYGMLSDWSDNADCRNWSYSSCILALGSTRFFADYCNATGRKELADVSLRKAARIESAIEQTFWRDDMGIHDWSRKRDGSWPRYRIPNYTLLPAWMGIHLQENRQYADVLAMKKFINRENGTLPTAPGDVEGFSGHNLAYMLFTLKKIGDSGADSVFNTLMNAPIISSWGTVSEFYGPHAVPNGHLLNPFSSGILGEALLRYFIGFDNQEEKQ